MLGLKSIVLNDIESQHETSLGMFIGANCEEST